jgi:hypothetical protein
LLDIAAILDLKRNLELIPNQQRRGWVLVAAIAIGIALVCLLALHAADSASVAVLTLALAGVISPLSLLPRFAFLYLAPAPDAPVLSSSFQRPPPFSIA